MRSSGSAPPASSSRPRRRTSAPAPPSPRCRRSSRGSSATTSGCVTASGATPRTTPCSRRRGPRCGPTSSADSPRGRPPCAEPDGGEGRCPPSGRDRQSGVVAAERTAPTADDGHGNAPTGTVTFLFSDVEGSTGLVRRLGDEYGVLLEQHHDLLRAAFGGHGGHEVDSQGDAFFFAFRRARNAVAAAVAAQRDLLEAKWPQDAVVRVRIGIHTGEPGLAAAGYHGVDVVRAARIAAAAHGGQIVVSTATRDIVGDDALPDLSFLDLGEHRLKGLDRPHRLFQVSAPGLPHEFPALGTERGEAGLDIGGREDDLAAAARVAVAAGQGSRVGRRRLIVVLSALAVAAAAALVGLALTREDEGAAAVVPNSVVRIEPEANEIVGVLPAGQNPEAVTTSGAHLWVANRTDDTLTHVDTRTGETRTLGGFPFPTSLDTQGNRIWVGNNTSGNIVAIDSETGAEVDRIRVPASTA